MGKNGKIPDKQEKIRKPRPTAFKKGKSGNPKGRPVDPNRKEALALLEMNSGAVAQKALDLVLCDSPNTGVLKALINKIFPDNLNLSGEISLTKKPDDELNARLAEILGQIAKNRGDSDSH